MARDHTAKFFGGTGQHEHGQRSEKRLAKSFQARLTPASGALSGAKSDFVLPSFRFEAKSTVNNSFSVKLEVLEKITREAMETNREPVVTVSFVTGNGQPRLFGDWVLIPQHVFRELTEE
jgi:hypothetical protein